MELENLDLKQQINFIGRLEENNATMFFIVDRKRRNHFWFFTKFCTCCLIRIKMETQKIANLLNDSENKSSKFATRTWCIINDQNNGQYGRGNVPNFCDYSDPIF